MATAVLVLMRLLGLVEILVRQRQHSDDDCYCKHLTVQQPNYPSIVVPALTILAWLGQKA